MLWPWNFPKYVGLTKEVDQWCHFSFFDHISENRHLVHKLHIGHLIQSLTSITPSPYPVCILLQKKVYTPNNKDINDFEIMISKEYWLFIKYSWKYFFFEIWYSKHSRHPYTNLKLDFPLLGFYTTGFSHSLNFLLQHVQRHI